MCRDTIYIAALLHDIGKFIERANCCEIDKQFKHIKSGRQEHSTQLIEVLLNKSPYFEGRSDSLMDLVAHHYESRNVWQEIIQLADWLSSSEREEGDTSGKYHNIPLTAVFSRLFNEENSSLGYELESLAINKGFPQTNPTVTADQYKRLADRFLQEFSLLTNEVQLYSLLEKYLWCVPAQTTNCTPDISLFDHSKTTAAIALCLYDQYNAGLFTADEFKKMVGNDQKHFMLIKGDVSGIQDFIFNVPGKGAAKTLKGHSVYINLLTDVIVKFIVRTMDLKDANVLYNGGGNFYILAPLLNEKSFANVKVKIAEKLFAFHQGDIYLALDYIALAPKDFETFNECWVRVSEKANTHKNKKWFELDLAKHHGEIFGPVDVGSKDHEHCAFCGVDSKTRRISYNEETEKSICSFCKSFMDLTEQLKNANCLLITEKDDTVESGVSTYQDLFHSFGYEYTFCKKQDLDRHRKSMAYLINSTEFLLEGYAGYKFGAYYLPTDINKRQQLSFDDIAQKSIGDPKMAILKLDVDNLGDIFINGLGDKATISRVTTLSRMFALYFEGYINYLIMEKGWEQHLYVVFSGGDDTFVVGSWNVALDFLNEFYRKFRDFTCNHPRVTFSAGITMVRYDFPITMSAQLTEDALDQAKKHLYPGEKLPTKNKISLFDEVFNWVEFGEIKDFKKLLLNIIENKQGHQRKEAFGRAFLYRIWKSTLGFRRILEDSLKGRVNNIRFWRLAYYLRDAARGDAEKLIGKYRKIVLDNVLCESGESQIRNIMLIPAAVKCAQMETRKVRGSKDEGKD